MTIKLAKQWKWSPHTNSQCSMSKNQYICYCLLCSLSTAFVLSFLTLFWPFLESIFVLCIWLHSSELLCSAFEKRKKNRDEKTDRDEDFFYTSVFFSYWRPHHLTTAQRKKRRKSRWQTSNIPKSKKGQLHCTVKQSAKKSQVHPTKETGWLSSLEEASKFSDVEIGSRDRVTPIDIGFPFNRIYVLIFIRMPLRSSFSFLPISSSFSHRNSVLIPRSSG